MVVYYVSDPAHPLLQSIYTGGVNENAQMISVFLDGDVAYLSEYANGLHAISIANPAHRSNWVPAS